MRIITAVIFEPLSLVYRCGDLPHIVAYLWKEEVMVYTERHPINISNE